MKKSFQFGFITAAFVMVEILEIGFAFIERLFVSGNVYQTFFKTPGELTLSSGKTVVPIFIGFMMAVLVFCDDKKPEKSELILSGAETVVIAAVGGLIAPIIRILVFDPGAEYFPGAAFSAIQAVIVSVITYAVAVAINSLSLETDRDDDEK